MTQKDALRMALEALNSTGINRGMHGDNQYFDDDLVAKALAACQSALAEQPALATCKSCNGNDGDAPCAYPGEGKHGCLRDARLALAEQDDEAVAYAEQDNVDMQSYDDLNFSYPVSTKLTENRTVPLYTRPAPKQYTEQDIDEAIGAVDWANTSWQQAAVEAKKLVMRFVGSQVTMEPNWIPVRDKLPEIDSDVLILSADHDWVILGEYSGEFYRYSEASGTERVMNVRFWSPIPILPKFLQEPIDKMTGGGK